MQVWEIVAVRVSVSVDVIPQAVAIDAKSSTKISKSVSCILFDSQVVESMVS